VPNDRFHDKAVQLADQIESEGIRVITTRAVMLEIGNALSKNRYRAGG
jgi:predicted nucleic acid-binding protein